MTKAVKRKSGGSGRSAVRVNIGGPKYTDRKGLLWAKDQAYSKNSWGCLDMPVTDILTTADPVSGTGDPLLFQSIRVGERVRYRFDVPNGKYRVRLLFAEIYWESSDAEQQDVCIQGRKALSGFNIFDEAGHDAALEKSFMAKVTKRFLEVQFVGVSLPMHSGARACAMEVEPVKTR